MEYLHIKNFKCFLDVKIPINNLTIFSGTNGNGKSTAIQALLFLRKTIEENDFFKKKHNEHKPISIEIDGDYCLSFGTTDALLPINHSDTNEIDLGLTDDDSSEKIEISYTTKEENKLTLNISKVSIVNEKWSQLFKKEFYYLNAERIGPRLTQKIKFNQFNNTGYQGEYTAQLIGDTNFNYTFKIANDRLYPNVKSRRLEQQLNAWLNFILPGVSVSGNCDFNTLTSQIKIENEFTKGNPTTAPNIGFGISYILPIIITCLIAEKASIIVIENPEAHLHPSAQSKIGNFLGTMANTGTTIIVETHSDHIINGIQLAVIENKIENEKVAINFFNKSKSEKQPNVLSIQLDKSAELTEWPEGFFDQSQKDLIKLFKMRSDG